MIIKTKVRYFLSLIIGIFLCVWVFNFFDGSEAFSIIKNNLYNMHYLIFTHLITLIFDSLSWFVLLGREKISFTWSLIITWISQACVKFLPIGNISGEFVRIYFLISKGLSSPAATSIVFADLILAAFSLLIISAVSFFVLATDNYGFFLGENNFVILSSLFLFFFVFLISFLLIRLRAIKKICRKFKKKNVLFSRRMIINLLKVDYLLYQLSFEKKKIINSLFLKIIGWICGALEIYVFLWIIDIEINFLDLIILESLMSLIRSFAFFIPASIGIQELAFVIVGSYLGLPDTISLTIAIGRRIREVLVSTPAILSWIIISKRNYI